MIWDTDAKSFYETVGTQKNAQESNHLITTNGNQFDNNSRKRSNKYIWAVYNGEGLGLHTPHKSNQLLWHLNFR